jgi:D-alanyl-D-alanine carboxypeptidase
MRAVRAAQLLERGFANNTLSWLRPTLGTVDNLVPIDASPPNLRDEMCGGKRKRPASDEDEDTVASNASGSGSETAITFFSAGLQPPALRPSEMLATAASASEPIIVYTGPTKTGPALIAAVAADSDKQTPRRGKKARIAGKKPVGTADANTEAKDARSEKRVSVTIGTRSTAKPVPSGARHDSAKRDPAIAGPADKPVAAMAKPAKPKTAAKPKPAPKNSTTGEAKPAAGQKTAAVPRT